MQYGVDAVHCNSSKSVMVTRKTSALKWLIGGRAIKPPRFVVAAISWWRWNNLRYGIRWRIASGTAAVLMLATIILPALQEIMSVRAYALAPETKQLVGKTDARLTKQLTYDQQNAKYQFNKDAIQSDSGLPAQLQRATTGTPKDKDSTTYGLDVPVDFEKGVTYHDANSQLSFSLVPEFAAKAGRQIDGHLVYPMSGGMQAIYTLKNNGLKEDIVLQKITSDAMTFSYQLHLPKSLEARVIPESGGAIGIYGADPTLFGDITYGSKDDQDRVQKARENSEKTTLVFGLPAPVIKTSGGQELGNATARFELKGDQLTVAASGLTGLKGPITIDPSVVVTSTSDFQNDGNNDGMISFSTSGQITRGGLTGGSVGAWTRYTTAGTNTFTTVRNLHASVAYNGYLYVAGGTSSVTSPYTILNDVQFAPISGSTVGPWKYTYNSTATATQTGGFITARMWQTMVAYNGYMYIVGGSSNGTNTLADIQYAPINSDGTLGTWKANATSLPKGKQMAELAAYNGYLYALGGFVDTPAPADTNDVLYAPINADGTVGSWTANTNLFATVREAHSVQAYNGFIYVIGGIGSSYLNDVQYAPLNSDGSVGVWKTSTAFSGIRGYISTAVYNGYMYVMGGYNGSVAFNDIQYAPIYGNGAVGPWATSTAFTNTRSSGKAAAYEGYIYLTGGLGANGPVYNDTQVVQINAAGNATAYTTGTSFTTTRHGNQAVVYGGYLYVMGGVNGTASTNTIYSASISSTGVVGAYTSRTAFTTNRAFFGAFAWNDTLFVVGGCSGATLASCTTATNDIATIYSVPITSPGVLGATWTSRGTFTTARYGHSVVAYNGYVYVMGGVNASTFLSDIQYSQLPASGNLAFTTSTVSLPAANAYFGAAAYGGKLYIAGGCSAGATTCTTVSNTVYYTGIGSTGPLTGAFTASGTFTNARGMLGLTVLNNNIYIMGGRNNTTYYSDTQFAPIDATGAVGTWTTSTASVLSSTRYGFGAASYGTGLFVVGGFNGTTYYTDTQSALVNNGGSGTITTWTANTAIPNAQFSIATIAYKGYIYLVGTDGTVKYAQIKADGTLGTGTTATTWLATTAYLGNTRSLSGIEAYNGYLYLIGGASGSLGADINEVQYTKVNSDGTLAGWAQTTTLTTGGAALRDAFFTAQYDGYVYFGGGVNYAGTTYYSDVWYAQILPSGALESTWHSTTGLPAVRSGPAAVVNNGYVYILGGGNSTITFADVQVGQFNASGGGVASWTPTNSTHVARGSIKAVVQNGYLYFFGGITGSTDFNDSYYAAINADGSLGTWHQTVSFTNARDSYGIATYAGFVYIIGGFAGAAATTSVQSAPFNSIARIGRYSKLVDFFFGEFDPGSG
jgi:hypothetical protein